MANEKTVKARVQQKHDIEFNWIKATNFIPKDGELIVYDAETFDKNTAALQALERDGVDVNLILHELNRDDTPIEFPRFKVGDGVTSVVSLPFAAGAQIDEPTIENITTTFDTVTIDAPYVTLRSEGNGVSSISLIPETRTVEIEAEALYLNGESVATKNNLADYAKKEDIATVYRFKGNISLEGLYGLDENERQIGDVWNITDYELGGINYAWTGESWDELGGMVDTSNFVERTNNFADVPEPVEIVRGYYTNALQKSSVFVNDGRVELRSINENSDRAYSTTLKVADKVTINDKEVVTTDNLIGRKGTATGAEAFNNSNNTASGSYSHAEGTKTTASKDNAHAEGWGTTASNNNAHAEGGGTTASGNSAHSEGGSTVAEGSYSHAEGYGSKALSNNAHAEGGSTKAAGANSHSEGNGSEAQGSTAHAEGYYNKAIGDQSHAGGQYSNATHGVSFVHGDHLETGRTYQAVFGTYNATDSEALLVVGNGNSTERKNAFTVSVNDVAYVGTKKVLVEGDIPTNISAFTNDANYSSVGQKTGVWNAEIFNSSDNTATADHAHAEGYKTNATGSGSHTEGKVTNASGDSAHAEGYDTLAEGVYSHAEGYKTKATLNNTHAEGNSTEASGEQAHAEGYKTIASANQAHAEGANTEATASAAHAEGYMTHANGNFSHAEGTYNIAEGGSSHAEGGHARNADQSIRVGGKNIAVGGSSHAEGISTRAGASFEHFAAHAEGAYTQALAPYAHAEGVGYVYSTPLGEITFDIIEGQSKVNTGNVSCDPAFRAGDIIKIDERDDTSIGGYTGKSYDVTIVSIDYDNWRIQVDMSFSCGSRYEMFPITPTIASGYASHASGICTIASGDAQTVVGKYNAEDDAALFIIGNGNGDYERSNAFWVTNNGEAHTQNGKLVVETNLPTKLSELENDAGYSTVGKKGQNNGEVFNSHSANEATGAHSHSEGANTHATGDHSHAEGHSTIASGEDAHAEGRDTTASGVAAHAEGWVTTASGKFSHAEGHTTHAEGDFSHSAGRDTFAIGNYSYADGQNTRAEGAYSRVGGWGARASGEYSFAHGIRANASAKNAYSFGADTTASGHHSVAFNNETIASGTESMAIGYATVASGNHAFAQGAQTIASGANAQATGQFTIASGNNSYAGGYGTYGTSFTALLHSSHVNENGYIDMIVNIPSSVTLNVGDYIVINYESQAYVVQTLGFNEVGSECYFTPSIYVGEKETFFDTNCNINIMNATEAAHNNSFAHGVEVKTGRDSQVVFGRYNEVDENAVFVIGNGTASKPNNAFTVTHDGNAFVGNTNILQTLADMEYYAKYNYRIQEITANLPYVEEGDGWTPGRGIYFLGLNEQCSDTSRFEGGDLEFIPALIMNPKSTGTFDMRVGAAGAGHLLVAKGITSLTSSGSYFASIVDLTMFGYDIPFPTVNTQIDGTVLVPQGRADELRSMENWNNVIIKEVTVW